jgi:uncharacterized membrane protein
MQRVLRLARLLSPLLVAPFVRPLFVRGPWDGLELWFLVTLALVTLALERLLLLSLSAWPPKVHRLMNERARQFDPRLGSFVGLMLVLVLVVYYYFYVGQRTVVVHHKMLTSSSDLAEFDNLFFNALKGHPFRSPAIEGSLQDWSALKVHAEFALYLLLPFYALRPGAETLLWIQTAVIALCAFPAYLLAARRLGRSAGLLFSVVLLFLPVVQRPNFYDFHFSPLGMLMVLWALYFLDGMLLAEGANAAASTEPLDGNRKSPLPLRVGFWVFFPLALLTREDVSLGFIVVGTVVALGARQLHLGVTIAALALTYFITIKFGIMPRFGSMWFDAIYQDLKAPEAGGFGAVAATLLSNPAFVLRTLVTEPKVLYLLHMSAPLLFLWMRKPVLWAAAAPGFISTLLVTNRAPMTESSFQYAYLWVPYIFVGAVLYLSSFERDQAGLRRRQAALLAMGVSAFAACYQMGVLLGGNQVKGGFLVKPLVLTEADYQRGKQLQELIEQIPPEASVTAGEVIGPHVSSRLVMYSLKYTLGQDADYLLVERPLIPTEDVHLSLALSSGQYGVIERSGPFWLLQRGANQGKNRSLLYWLDHPK